MIKLFLADVDSTLTDGIYHVSEHGRISKNFFTRDFWGLWKLHESGVQVAIITAGGDDVIDHQCRRCAKYVDIIKGSKDKRQSIKDRYVHPDMFSWNEIAYIGDDVFDIELLSAVGLCACPLDAVGEVLEVVKDRECIESDEGFHSKFEGGKGCVREFAEYVLAINEALKND